MSEGVSLGYMAMPKTWPDHLHSVAEIELLATWLWEIKTGSTSSRLNPATSHTLSIFASASHPLTNLSMFGLLRI
jgi:hypothetical protein